MAHYAFLNENNVVTEVIVGKDETELIEGLSPEEWYGNFRGQKCLRTSYNTFGGKNKVEGKEHFRKNFAGIGFTYDETRDAFIAPKLFYSWTLNEETCQWEAPTPYPKDDKVYFWDEPTLSWEEVK